VDHNDDNQEFRVTGAGISLLNLHLTPDPTTGLNASLPVNQTNHFFNLGYGWLCKHCSNEKAEQQPNQLGSGRLPDTHEKERCEPRLSSLALASWTDSARHSLTCPRCGIEETVKA